jgi:DNA-binding transcriptional regulator YhcF (GntR family)
MGTLTLLPPLQGVFLIFSNPVDSANVLLYYTHSTVIHGGEPMEFDARVPIYLQIMEKIKKDIVSGTLKRGEKMPSVRNMAAELKVNVNTMQRVYQELERDDVIVTQRGTGSFVTEDEDIIFKLKSQMAYHLLSSFVQGMLELGLDNRGIVASLNQYLEERENGIAEN